MNSQKLNSLSTNNKKLLREYFNYSHIKDAKKESRFRKLNAPSIYEILQKEYNKKVDETENAIKNGNELKQGTKNENLKNEINSILKDKRLNVLDIGKIKNIIKQNVQ